MVLKDQLQLNQMLSLLLLWILTSIFAVAVAVVVVDTAVILIFYTTWIF